MRGRSLRIRSKILIEYAARIPAFLREKAALYATAGTTAEKHLEFLLQVTDEEGHGAARAAPTRKARTIAAR